MLSPRRFPPVLLATCPIPWTETHEFDEALFRTCVVQLSTHLTPRLYIFFDGEIFLARGEPLWTSFTQV